MKLQMVVFCCKIRNAIWGYPGFRATTQKHHMGISGIRSKQLRAPYGVSRARWVNQHLIITICMAACIFRLHSGCKNVEISFKNPTKYDRKVPSVKYLKVTMPMKKYDKIAYIVLTLLALRFLAGAGRGGGGEGVFHPLHSSFVFKDYTNFVQNYFEIR